MTTKEDVLQFLAKEHSLPSEQFNEGFRLYQKSRNKNLAQERFLNKVGYTPTTLSTVLYEIKKLHNVSDTDLANYKAELYEREAPEAGDGTGDAGTGDAGTGEEDINPYKIETIEELSVLIKSKINEGTEELKTEIKFRDEFPFLSNPDIPEELKILVTDKFGHYHAFADAHRALVKTFITKEAVSMGKEEISEEEKNNATNNSIFILAKQAVENFQADQLIYDELKHYQDHGTILGVHPIFKERKLKTQVDNMTIAETAKRKNLLENYIRRDTNNIEKAKSDEERTKFTDKVALWNKELVLVKLKLGESVS